MRKPFEPAVASRRNFLNKACALDALSLATGARAYLECPPFPASPTLTIVALALRQAEHVAQSLSRRET